LYATITPVWRAIVGKVRHEPLPIDAMSPPRRPA
jgi:hypothetical protein